MRYVLDASVAVRWVLSGPHAMKAHSLRAEFQAGRHELLAPGHFTGEVAAALTKAERQRIIAVGQALPLLNEILKTPPALHEYHALVPRAVLISSRTRHAFHDCLYVALAEQERCELVTADDRLVKNLQPHFPFIIALSSLP